MSTERVSAVTATTASARYAWMDVLRGIAILLVIALHAVDYASSRSGHDFHRLDEIATILNPLRMPMLFFLSGMLVPRSLKKGVRTYTLGKVKNVLYPYLLWSVVIVAVSHFAENTIGYEWAPEWIDIITDPFDQMWFLAYLFIFYMLAAVLRGVPALAIAFVCLAVMTIRVGGDWLAFWNAAVPFFVGVALGEHSEAVDRSVKRFWVAALVFTAGIALSTGNVLGLINVPGYGWRIPLYVALCYGLAGLVYPIATHKWMFPLRYLGKRTIKLYILHVPFILFTLISITYYTDWRDPWGMLWLALFVGLVPPLIVTLLADRFRSVEWLFAWNPRPDYTERLRDPNLSK